MKGEGLLCSYLHIYIGAHDVVVERLNWEYSFALFSNNVYRNLLKVNSSFFWFSTNSSTATYKYI